MGTGILIKRGFKPSVYDVDMEADGTCWEDVTCPICLDCPHNAVLLRCTSYEKGCRPYICDTDQSRSNCLERFRSAHGTTSTAKVSSIPNAYSIYIITSNTSDLPTCPLCRGDVLGWIVIDKVRLHLNQKLRCCEENSCLYAGNYFELQKHTQLKHPNSRPSQIDPARRLDWENFQQSSDIIDVLSTIHSQVPNGIVLGDYVIEYGDDEAVEDYEVFRRVRGRWWSSFIFCRPFCRNPRSRRRSAARDRRGSGRQASQQFSIDNFGTDGSRRSVDLREIRYGEFDDDFIISTVPAA